MTVKDENPDVLQAAEGFSAQWLTLREPADHKARSTLLTQLLVDWQGDRGQINIIELGAGTGSNLRYLSPLLGHHQQWTLFDNDQLLLEQLPELLQPWANKENITLSVDTESIRLKSPTFSATVRWQHKDLANGLSTLPLHNVDLITGSALLDLTSALWLEQLAQLCTDNHCASLFVLNYDGTIQWHEELVHDNQLNTLLNAHQLNDKGFGRALGPQAHHYYAQQLRKAHQVTTQTSNWNLDKNQSTLQTALLTGWVPAAIDQDSTHKTLIEHWSENRQSIINQERSSLKVGHTDVLSLPIERLQ